MKAITYRGLKVNLGTQVEALAVLKNYFSSNSQHQVITLNPEYVVLAHHNPALTELTQNAGLCLVDGIGLALALRRFGLLERYPGADLVPELLNYCAPQKLKIGVVLLPGGLSMPEQVKTRLIQKFSNLQLSAWYADHALTMNIQQFKPALLLVALGQPEQDFWIAEHLATFPSIRVAIGVGGAIDFLTGARRRAPRLMRTLGVEWLWRLVTQPKRFPRILRATFGFWYTILFR